MLFMQFPWKIAKIQSAVYTVRKQKQRFFYAR